MVTPSILSIGYNPLNIQSSHEASKCLDKALEKEKPILLIFMTIASMKMGNQFLSLIIIQDYNKLDTHAIIQWVEK